MKIKLTLIFLLLFCSVIFCGSPCWAIDQSATESGSEDKTADVENNEENEVIGQTTFVDENGNITTVDVYDGTTGEVYNPYARVVTTANMVNFNCSKAGVTTSFVDANTGQAGYVSKASAADAAYLGMENGKVKFMMSGVVGLVDPSLVEIVTQGTYYASNYEVNSQGKLYHYISNNVNATGNQGNYNYVGEGPSYLVKGKEYYSYDGHYFYTDYNVMINDYKNNVRTNSVNPQNPYYNYFQYLPLRSKTNYTGSQLTTYLNNKTSSTTSKLNNTGDLFVTYQNKYGVNALLAASFAALESGWGKSSIALGKNNLFGLNATDNNPSGNADTYPSVENCIYDFTANWMSLRYLNPTYTNLFRGGYFGDKGSGIFGKYSSDPYEGEKCAAIAANMDAGISNADKNYYSIGIKDISGMTYTSLNVREKSNTQSAVYYTTIKNSSYAFIIASKTKENGFYKIQNEKANSDGTFNFNSFAYVSANYVSQINSGHDLVITTGWQFIDSEWYYFDTSGYAKKGWYKEGNTWYYLKSDYKMARGLQTIGSNLCYFNSSGAMQTGWQKVDGKWYYFNASGYGVKGWIKLGNIWYYLDQNYQMLTGLQTVGSNLCYFNSNGAMQTGWQYVEGKWYYFNASGYGVKGWIKLGNIWYYLDQNYQMLTGLQTVGSNLCYFSNSGAMQTGWQYVEGKWYYFNASGYAVKGWYKEGNVWYYLDNTGKMMTGWIEVSGKTYYLQANGKMVTGQVEIDGQQYLFSADGHLVK